MAVVEHDMECVVGVQANASAAEPLLELRMPVEFARSAANAGSTINGLVTCCRFLNRLLDHPRTTRGLASTAI